MHTESGYRPRAHLENVLLKSTLMQETPHLDPLPFCKGEGQAKRWPISKANPAGFPLPLGGEDQGENSPIQIAQCAPEPGKSADVDYQWLANTVHGQGDSGFGQEAIELRLRSDLL